MSERCPLTEGLYWDSQIPQHCTEICEELWEKAEADTEPITDLINSDCQHSLEFGGATLQRGEGAKRFWTILTSCVVDCEDVINETFTFTCPEK